VALFTGMAYRKKQTVSEAGAGVVAPRARKR
jgi:hypothetical protein